MKVSLAWYEVTDFEKAKEFYGNVLGLKNTFSMPQWMEFSADGDRKEVSIGLALRPEAKPGNGGATVVFNVPDVEAKVKELSAKSVPFDGPINEYPGVVRIATFHDPFGNKLQLAQVLMR